MTDDEPEDLDDMPPVDALCFLLRESGAKVTFSINCRSGIVGDACRCWRCQQESGDADARPDDETEAWWGQIAPHLRIPGSML